MPDARIWSSIVASRASGWRTVSPATNHPKPWRAFTRPSSRSTSSALRTVTRLTENSSDSSDSLGIRRPAEYSPEDTRTRSSSAIWW